MEKQMTSSDKKPEENFDFDDVSGRNDDCGYNDSDDDNDDSLSPWTIVLGISIIGIIAVILISLCLSHPVFRQWVTGLGICILLTGIEFAVIYLLDIVDFDENGIFIFNFFFLPAILITNFVLRSKFDSASYDLIFHIFLVWIAIASVINTILFEKLRWLNIVFLVCSVFLFFLWPGDFSQTTWQWIFGIGSSILLSVLIIALTFFIDFLFCESLAIIATWLLFLSSIANIILLFTLGTPYLFIGQCLAVTQFIGTVITAICSYVDDEPKFGTFALIIAFINAALFFALLYGHYPAISNFIHTLLSK